MKGSAVRRIEDSGHAAPGCPRLVRYTPLMSRILVAEDDPDIASLLTHYLQRAGFEADMVSSGRDVLPRIRKAPPDLLLLDLMLPGLDGLEVCRAVRGRRANRRRSRSSWSRPRAKNPTASWGSSSALTTTSPSRSAPTRSSRASARCCAEPSGRARLTAG